ncbi:MAG: MBL fold metallo-hydrolase [Desulfobacterales bacterium]|nr:MBL fold metallo-hydrolase [Desulfobacterales bacterium]
MIIKQLTVGPIMANCYILGCERTREAAVIDPGDETDKILMSLASEKLTLKHILNTHGHFDHVGGNRQLKDATGAELLIHAADAAMLAQLSASAAAFGLSAQNSPPPDRTVVEGDRVTFGDIALTVLHTPGHTPGGISFHTDRCVFVGDALFYGSIGRTDFPGGDYDTLIASIRTKLFTLDDDTTVYTGHGPATTVGQEKRSNPFVRLR